MSARRWTPLFFVPTPVLRFVVGDVWWWVPFAMWVGGLVLLARYSIGAFGLLGTCLASLVIAFIWSLAGRVFLRMVRDALCLRESLPGVVGWRFQAIVDWIVPGGPSWTFVAHDDGRELTGSFRPWARRLRIWQSPEGGVRGAHDRYWTTADGLLCHELVELSRADAIDFETTAADFAGSGFPKGTAGIGFTGPSVLLFRRGSRPRARDAVLSASLQSSWISLWWAGLQHGRRPVIVDLRAAVPSFETRVGVSFSLDDEEDDVRASVGSQWDAADDGEGADPALRWADRGLRVAFDSSRRAAVVELGLPACGGLWLPGDQWVPTWFGVSAAGVIRSLRAVAIEQDLRVDAREESIAVSELGIRLEFDGPLPLTRGGELLLSDSWPRSDGDLPALVQITVERRVTSS